VAGLVVVHRRRPIPLVPDELHLPAIEEEDVPSSGIVVISTGIHALLRSELDVVVMDDGRTTSYPSSQGHMDASWGE
jgi:tetraacyldisaccharide-1-P 4'-kinase